MAAAAVAGTLLAGLASASPALAEQGDTQLCSPSTNGCAMVNGVGVLPALNVGQNAEEFLTNSGGGVDTWTIVSGSLPPGMSLSPYPKAGTEAIIGTPDQQGTFTFTVDNAPFADPSALLSQGTYSSTINPPLPLTITSTSPLPAVSAVARYAENVLPAARGPHPRPGGRAALGDAR